MVLRVLGPIQLPLNMWASILTSGRSSGGSDITAATWQTFDFSTLSNANLLANDHNGTGSWTVTDGGTVLSMSTSGPQALVSTVNGSSTAGGTYGLAMAYTGTLACQAQYNPASSYGSNATSFCGAIITTAMTLDADVELAYWYNVAHLKYRKSGSTYSFLISGTGDSGTITITAGTAYILSLLVQQNATCKLRVYTTAGVQVGSEVTCTGSNSALSNPIFGETNTHVANTGTFYYSNWCINTSGTYPLGP